MFRTINKTIIFITIILMCNCKGPISKNTQQDKNDTITNQRIDKDDNLQICDVNDSAKNLIDQLNLCEYFIIKNDCYNSNSSRFVRLTSDSSYQCFLFTTEGGSGSEVIRVYNRKNGKHELINDFFAFYDTIPGSLTGDYYDLQLAYRDYDRGYIETLFKWDGQQYQQNKILSVNNIPINLLIELGIIDKMKLSSKHPYVGETAGFNELVYGNLSIDTIENKNGNLLLKIQASNYPETDLFEPVTVKLSNGRYKKLATRL